MEFDTKIKLILREDLEMWQKLNITAFLMSGIGGTQNIIGQPYVDKDNVHYLPMSQQPIMIYSSSGEKMSELLEKALTRKLLLQYTPKNYLTLTMTRTTEPWSRIIVQKS